MSVLDLDNQREAEVLSVLTGALSDFVAAEYRAYLAIGALSALNAAGFSVVETAAIGYVENELYGASCIIASLRQDLARAHASGH